MKIDELILALQAIRAEHGNLDVTRYGFRGDVQTTKAPTIEYARIRTGREELIRYFNAPIDPETKRGTKIVRL